MNEYIDLISLFLTVSKSTTIYSENEMGTLNLLATPEKWKGQRR
jgi:hypothetical protein